MEIGMAEELQSLIEKINRDGVERANAEAERIVSEAKAKAATIVDDAKAKADQYAKDAEKKAAESAERASETIRQASRDAVISVENAVSRLLERLLKSNVDAALADPATAASVAAEAVRELVGPGEISSGGKVTDAIRSQLAAKGSFKVVLDETLGSGFMVRLEGGRVEHDFTGATIAEELAKRLRPDLAKLMSEA